MSFISTFGNWCSGSAFGHGAGYGMAGFMPFHFGGILSLIVIAMAVYLLVGMFRRPSTCSYDPSPSEILKRRYAAGEIDKQTYNRMKDDLK
ncbi:SHOCT domain-containing protein [Maridesulfovibrio zosterae]|uniref:SHOCT domain-containing protein n=1 Tax=Maridesulfovibrio zosterae TaxID=82171 RepID=UPI0004250B78|nr:SHOCT domain-containing protein [Maridesulfovibrio zosterae]